MKWIHKTGLWLGATAITAAMAFPAGQQDAAQIEKAERILNLSYTTCHDIRKVQTQARDEESWNKIVNSMVEKGAKVPKDDVPIFDLNVSKNVLF